MRKTLCFLTTCCCLLVAEGIGWTQDEESPLLGKKLEGVELEDTFGAKISVEDYRGSVLVLLGGTTW